MPYSSPFLQLDQLRQERDKDEEDRIAGAVKAFGQAPLDLMALQKEHEDRKQKFDMQNAELKLKQDTFSQLAQDHTDDRQIKLDAASQATDQLHRKNEAEDLGKLVTGVIGDYHPNKPDDYVPTFQDAIGAIKAAPEKNQQYKDEDIQAEWEKQKHGKDLEFEKARHAGVMERQAEVNAGLRARGVAVSETNSGIQRDALDERKLNNSKLSDRQVKGLEDAAKRIDTLNAIMDFQVAQNVPSGPIAGAVAAVRAFLKIPDTDVQTRNTMAAAFANQLIHDYAGSAQTEQELARAMLILPSNYDPASTWRVLTGVLIAGAIRDHNAILDTAQMIPQTASTAKAIPRRSGARGALGQPQKPPPSSQATSTSAPSGVKKRFIDSAGRKYVVSEEDIPKFMASHKDAKAFDK